jgi:hypothetical protein
MSVQLSSLRVTAGMDAAAYVRGAQQKVAADNQMIDSDRRAQAARAQADAAMARAIPGMASVSKALLEGYSAGAQFEAQIRRIGNAVDKGMGLDRAVELVDAAYRKFGLVADATALAQQGFVSIAPAIDAVTKKYELQAEAARRAASAASDVATAEQAQAKFNAITGVKAAAGGNRAEDIAAYGSALDQLRAKFNPLFAAGQTYKATLDEINQAARVGAISERERGAAIDRTKVAFADQVRGLRGVRQATADATAAAGMQRHELVNLSRQMQDVVVSLAGGQGLGTVLLQQGSQIGDVFATSRATVGSFARQAVGWLGSFLTAGRLAFGGVAAAVTGAGFALNDYLGKQKQVSMSLTGAGRASGATVGGINSIAAQGASTFGLSVSESRELASALAATGKVANDNILPIVKMGKDIAHAFGIDAAEATKLLAESFADPAKGAETLNQRLGFLDAATRRNIENLVAQNKVFEAQKVLLAGVRSGLAGIDDAVSKSTKGWTAIANAVSNAWDTVGKFIARGLGLEKLDPAEQLEKAEQAIARIQARMQQRSQNGSADIGGWIGGTARKADASDAAELDREIQARDKLAAALRNQAEATIHAQGAQRSFAQEAAVRSALPDIAQLEGLNNQLRLLSDLFNELATDEGAGARLRQLGLTFEAVSRAIEKAKAEIRDFRTDNEKLAISAKISQDAVTAYSPSAKADIARRQAAEQYRGNPEREIRAEEAYTLSLKQSTEAIREQHRERRLAGQQAVDSLQLEIDMIGKGIAEQTSARTNLQAHQQLSKNAPQSSQGAKPANDNQEKHEKRTA